MIQTADSAGQTSVGSHITHLYSAGWGLGALAFAANLKNSCHIGLVLLGKFTDFTPRFNGKNHGFRLRFSQLNQSNDCHISEPSRWNPLLQRSGRIQPWIHWIHHQSPDMSDTLAWANDQAPQIMPKDQAFHPQSC